MSESYDFIIIGSGAGGGTLAHALAPTGKKILIIERGDYLKREKENWSPKAVFAENRYHTHEKWYDHEGKPFTPGMNYYVGGNTKVYGAALLRLRKEDFGEIHHYGGLSPAWPLKYEDFQSYYLAAEKLYHVHGKRGEDPTEPPDAAPFPYEAISHEPYIQKMADQMKEMKLHPFHLPLGLMLNEKARHKSPCIRCDTCDGFPCLVNAKADAHIVCVAPALEYGNVRLLTNAKALRLIPNEAGDSIQEVEVDVGGKIEHFRARTFVVSCGAINSAALFLRSKHRKHPRGLANGSDQVGRNYMFHTNSVMISVSKDKNPTFYEKTLAINDYYFKAPDSKLPLGHIQLLGNVKKEMLEAEAPFFVPGIALDFLAEHSVGWWLTTEDLPSPENRISLNEKGEIVLSYTPNNNEAHERLHHKLKEILNHLGGHLHLFPNKVYLSQNIPIGGCAHQAGTLRFGKDPATSVLDLNCKAHELDNLYAVDSSFFPSIGAVNPTLTIIANALRIAEHLSSLR
ncbi:MAG: GMC family oxidoreductase [Verrucomicrobia bacterium]|nr:GMC family oxidoreductase [Verrucomicrobiota bacterium]